MEQTGTVFFFEKCRLCLDKPGLSNICEVQDLPQDIFACTCVKVNNKLIITLLKSFFLLLNFLGVTKR